MIPYEDLAENVKEYDRVTARAVMEAIPELQGWIPVTERLPDDNVNAQVTFIGYGTNKQHCDGVAFRDGGFWYWSLDDSECEVEIIAWKPCGEPYKPED